MNKINILAIIPARKNSKRIKNKNMRLINNKPLIYYTINEAIKLKKILDVVLTTDSEIIFNYAKKFKNLHTPFMRPSNLAKDYTETLPVLIHATKFMENYMNCKYDYILLLQPTCPMRTSRDIKNTINLILSKNADSVISVSDVGPNHPYRMKKILKNGRLANIFDKMKKENMQPIQKLKKFYIRNGAIYLTKRDIIIKNNSIVGKKTFPYIMTQEKSINIDTPEDLILAKYKMKSLLPKSKIKN